MGQQSNLESGGLYSAWEDFCFELFSFWLTSSFVFKLISDTKKNEAIFSSLLLKLPIRLLIIVVLMQVNLPQQGCDLDYL